ncbi:glycosyltransferase family 1 protein [Alteribacter natronophilus]|uniref:glycosyltransferase family 1 protein n=1 Tax=Alteribacter natronophilus TaxID=2583810 RepID=UPI00110DCEB6|nr:glycosyltransferase family 1 protein [Alteribacter natronophilus]TMW70546.1 glycosyltransferase family 1 protein [Alteribacter natronophilus]
MQHRRPLKVLHVVGAMNRAGTETMLMNVFRHMDRNKIMFDFVSYSSEEADYDREIISLGGRVIRLSKTYGIMDLVHAMKTYGPYDVVHAHTLFHCGIANAAAAISGVKVRIAHAHTTDDDRQTIIRKLYTGSMKRLIRATSTDYMACSSHAGGFLFGENVLSSDHYRYLPNVIPFKQYMNPDAEAVKKVKQEFDLENRFVVGHIGRMIEPKNHSFLLKVFKELMKKEPRAVLLLVGDGDLRLEIEQQVSEENLAEHVRFAGLRNDIPNLLNAMDAFVFPSIYEGLGLVLLEAQASGVSCVVSEAIQPEADLDLGLMARRFLHEAPEKWAEQILAFKNKLKPGPNEISEAFVQNAYSVDQGIQTLAKIYRKSWRQP